MFAGGFPVNQKSVMVPALLPPCKSQPPRRQTVSKDQGRPPQRVWSKKPHKGGSHNRPFKSHSGTRPPRGEDGGGDDGPLRLFGLHAVEAALRNPARMVVKLMLTENAERRLAEALGGSIGHPV